MYGVEPPIGLIIMYPSKHPEHDSGCICIVLFNESQYQGCLDKLPAVYQLRLSTFQIKYLVVGKIIIKKKGARNLTPSIFILLNLQLTSQA